MVPPLRETPFCPSMRWMTGFAQSGLNCRRRRFQIVGFSPRLARIAAEGAWPLAVIPNADWNPAPVNRALDGRIPAPSGMAGPGKSTPGASGKSVVATSLFNPGCGGRPPGAENSAKTPAGGGKSGRAFGRISPRFRRTCSARSGGWPLRPQSQPNRNALHG